MFFAQSAIGLSMLDKLPAPHCLRAAMRGADIERVFGMWKTFLREMPRYIIARRILL